jgi:hypothetical protein
LEQLGPDLQGDFSMGLPMVVSRLQDSTLQSDGWMDGCIYATQKLYWVGHGCK